MSADYEELMETRLRLTYYNPAEQESYQQKARSEQEFKVSRFATESDKQAICQTIKGELLPENTVGLKSNALNNEHEHHVFLEWDKKNIGIERIQREVNGTLAETARGFHLIKPAQLTIHELIAMQQLYGCCDGFREYTIQRGYATMRVGFKEGSYLKILENGDPSELLDWYLILHQELSEFGAAKKKEDKKPDQFDLLRNVFGGKF